MREWITGVIESAGAAGVAFLMFAENIFPPIPSEVVMPAAGYAARDSEHSFVLLLTAGAIGSLLGVLPWYFAARYIGNDRFRRWVQKYGKWLALHPDEVDRATRWFDRWGGVAVLAGRLVPGVRTLISVPAGFAEMRFGKFLIYSAIGTFLWSLLLAALGWWLQGQNEVVDRFVGWLGVAVIVGCVVTYLYRVAKYNGWLSGRTEASS